MPLASARRLLGESALIGLSITEAAQMGAPEAVLADCLGVGAIFPTGSKTDATLTGLALVADVLAAGAAWRQPIVAIGGIDAENAGAAIRAGADVVAVISAITAAQDPGRAAAELLEAVRAAEAALPARSSR